MTETTPATPALEVRNVWRNGTGAVDALELGTTDGHAFSFRLRPDGTRGVMWATPEVWAHPAAYGLERYTCPGHGGSDICQYGACDEIRYPGIVPEVLQWPAVGRNQSAHEVVITPPGRPEYATGECLSCGQTHHMGHAVTVARFPLSYPEPCRYVPGEESGAIVCESHGVGWLEP